MSVEPVSRIRIIYIICPQCNSMDKRALDPAQYERFLRFCQMEEQAKHDDHSSRRHGHSSTSSGSKSSGRSTISNRSQFNSISSGEESDEKEGPIAYERMWSADNPMAVEVCNVLSVNVCNLCVSFDRAFAKKLILQDTGKNCTMQNCGLSSTRDHDWASPSIYDLGTLLVNNCHVQLAGRYCPFVVMPLTFFVLLIGTING